MKTTFERFLPIAKVDDEERMVYGYASTPTLDSDGEIIKVEAFEKALPEYMKFPTIREMHQPKAVGSTKSAELTKDGLYIGAKVVSDEAWKMVKEGVYRGFSIGGNVIQRVKNVITDLSLTEISLVDVPANKASVIEVWKSKKIEKKAWTMAELSRIAMDLKYIYEVFEYEGKSTKEIKKVLEMVKSLVATEASEPEDSDEKMKYAKALATILQKGGDKTMTKEDEVLRKSEEQDVVVEEKDETDVSETVETKEDQNEAEPENQEEQKEAGDIEATLEKADKALETKVEKQESVEKTESLQKSVLKMAQTIEKMANKINSLEDRLVTVEKTPAQAMSKSVSVVKELGTNLEVSKDKKVSPEMQKKLDRMDELKKMRDDLGAREYERQGYTREATRLQDEINRMS